MSSIDKGRLCVPSNHKYLVDSKKKDCRLKWNIIKEIGKGEHGTIWEICCDNDCNNYILKFIKFRKEKDLQHFKEEVEIQNLIAEKTNIAIPVVDAWVCEGGGVIIMKKLKMDIPRLVEEYYKSVNVIYEILNSCLLLVIKLYLLGFYHGDLIPDNIMVDYEEHSNIYKYEMEKYQNMNYKYYIIDMGTAGKLKNELTKKDIKEYLDFDLLIFLENFINDFEFTYKLKLNINIPQLLSLGYKYYEMGHCFLNR